MKLRPIPYPCIGYCVIDARGYCVACGRPPNLGMPDGWAGKKTDKAREESKAAVPPDTDDTPHT